MRYGAIIPGTTDIRVIHRNRDVPLSVNEQEDWRSLKAGRPMQLNEITRGLGTCFGVCIQEGLLYGDRRVPESANVQLDKWRDMAIQLTPRSN